MAIPDVEISTVRITVLIYNLIIRKNGEGNGSIKSGKGNEGTFKPPLLDVFYVTWMFVMLFSLDGVTRHNIAKWWPAAAARPNFYLPPNSNNHFFSAKRGIAIVCRPSVCPSVTLRYTVIT